MALHCHLALLKTKENNGDMKKNTAMEVQLRNKNNRIVLLL